MGGLAGLFARCFVIGIAVAAPVGAMAVLCVQRTLREGLRAGLATGLGIATSDGLYASAAAFGLTAVSHALAGLSVPLRLAGGAALVAIGMRAVLAAPRSLDVRPASRQARGHYLSAVALTLTNPMTIMAFAAVFATAGLAAVGSGALGAGVATAGVASGSLAWWIALVAVVSLVRSRVDDRALGLVSRVSGATIAAFGVVAAVSVLR